MNQVTLTTIVIALSTRFIARLADWCTFNKLFEAIAPLTTKREGE